MEKVSALLTAAAQGKTEKVSVLLHKQLFRLITWIMLPPQIMKGKFASRARLNCFVKRPEMEVKEPKQISKEGRESIP